MPANNDNINSLNSKLQAVEKRLENARGASTVLETQVSRALDRLILKGQGLEDIFRAVNSSLLDSVNRMGIINPLVNQIFGSSKSTIGMNDGLLGGLFSGLLGSPQSNQSFKPSQSQITASLADAVRRGSNLR